MPVNKKDLSKFNHYKEMMKLDIGPDEVLLTTKEELKDFFITYLDKEFDLIAKNLSERSRKRLVESVEKNLSDFQNKIWEHVELKLEKVTETIITRMLSSKIEEEVKRRVDIRLQEIKNKL